MSDEEAIEGFRASNTPRHHAFAQVCLGCALRGLDGFVSTASDIQGIGNGLRPARVQLVCRKLSACCGERDIRTRDHPQSLPSRSNPLASTEEPTAEDAAASSDTAEAEEQASAPLSQNGAVESSVAEEGAPAPPSDDPESPSTEENQAAEVTPVGESPAEAPVEESVQEPAEESAETPAADVAVEAGVSEGG